MRPASSRAAVDGPLNGRAPELSDSIGRKIISKFREMTFQDDSTPYTPCLVMNNNRKPTGTTFNKGMEIMRRQYPTSNHVNKFVLGLACEYLFCHALRKQGLPVYLCSDDAVRNDVFYAHNKNASNKNASNAYHQDLPNNTVIVGDAYSYFEYSLKYKSPNGTKNGWSVPNIRLVNTQGGRVNTANIKEDVFLIIPNPEPPKGIQNPNYCYYGKIVFIPYAKMQSLQNTNVQINGKTVNYGEVLDSKKDGIDLVAHFVNTFIKDPRNRAYMANIDVPYTNKASTIDSIKTLTNAALEEANMETLDESMFLCRDKKIGPGRRR
jgi:hypothetical protein